MKIPAIQQSSRAQQALKRTTAAGFFGFKLRHFVMVAILLMTLLAGLYFYTIQSDAYQEAEHFALTNPEVVNLTGPISEVSLKFWSGFDVTYSGSSGEANFVLSVRGENDESVLLDVRLMRYANSWKVIEAYLTSTIHKGLPIKQKTGISGAHLDTKSYTRG